MVSNNSSKKALIKAFLAFGFALLVFTSMLLAVGSRAFGWFSDNRNVGTSGAGVNVFGNDVSAHYEVYVYDININRPTNTKIVDDEEIELSVKDIEFQQYDVTFRSRNRYTPIIIRIKLSGDVLSVGAGETGNIFITIKRQGAAIASTDTLPLTSSSVMRFTGITNGSVDTSTAEDLYGDVDALLYDSTRATITNTTNSKTFATIEEVNNEQFFNIESEITLTVSYDNDCIINGQLDVFLYVTYDELLIGKLPESFGDEAITLENDFAMLSVDYPKDED